MNFNRKGQGLSMNVIIIAAIALLVLVILAVLLFNAGGNVSDANACDGDVFNGRCVQDGVSCSDGTGGAYPIANPAGNCAKNQHCCVKVGGN